MLFGSQNVYTPGQVELLQRAFEAALAEAARCGKSIQRYELARRLMSELDEGEDSAAELARRALQRCGRKA